MSSSLVDLLNQMEDEQEGKTRLGDVIARFEDRGFGPLLLMPALIALLPTGAIPGVTYAVRNNVVFNLYSSCHR